MNALETRPPARMCRRRFLRLAAASCLAGLAPGWISCRADSVSKVGDTPAARTLEDLQGNPVVVPSDFRGRVALLHFWAAWCPFCRPEMRVLQALSGKYGGKALVPCSINLGESREVALSYTRNLGLTYPVLLDPKSSLVRPYGISGVPTTFILDREGVIRHRIVGEVDREGLETLIRALL